MAGSNRNPPLTINRIRPPSPWCTRRKSSGPMLSPTRRPAPFSASSQANAVRPSHPALATCAMTRWWIR